MAGSAALLAGLVAAAAAPSPPLRLLPSLPFWILFCSKTTPAGCYLIMVVWHSCINAGFLCYDARKISTRQDKPPNTLKVLQDNALGGYERKSMLHQPDLFLQDRIPHKPYCKDYKEAPMLVRSYAHAIKRRYIQVNPPHLRMFMLFDLDYDGAALAWEDENLPMPAWAAVNRENGHAHIAYALSAPVLTADYGGRQAALRYLAAVEAAYHAKMRCDDGFTSLITKNPEHPYWLTLRGVPDAIRGYDLPYLAEFVDLAKFKPYVGRTNPEAEGLGRNCTVFNVVSRWAYRNIRDFKFERGIREWKHEVLHQCLTVNSDFPYPMMLKEVQCIAKSISNWVWTRFDIAASDRRFSALQAHRNSLRKTNAGRSKIITEL